MRHDDLPVVSPALRRLMLGAIVVLAIVVVLLLVWLFTTVPAQPVAAVLATGTGSRIGR